VANVAETDAPRAAAAREAGLRAGFSVPIVFGTEVVGGLEFFTSDDTELDPRFEDALASIGTQLGQVIFRKRMRFGKGRLFSRFESARAVMRAVREGHGFFNLPDMDFGARDAAFVPFFGIPAATLLAPSRLARALDMVVQPVVAEVLPRGQGYRVRFLQPLSDFPTDDALADTVRMNHWIEQEVRRIPEQYLWLHKRFKTRPPGEPSLY